MRKLLSQCASSRALLQKNTAIIIITTIIIIIIIIIIMIMMIKLEMQFFTAPRTISNTHTHETTVRYANELLKPLSSEGREEIGVLGEKPQRRHPKRRKCTNCCKRMRINLADRLILRTEHPCALLLFVGCLTSQPHATVSQGRICSDNATVR